MNLGRCFVGIPLAPQVVDALVRATATFSREDPAWTGEKWVREENLHVTLAFLGRVEEGSLAGLLQRLDGALAEVEAFDLHLRGIKPVPARRRSKMLWAALDDPDGACARLAAAIVSAAGLETGEPHRPFKPHITLARARRPRAVSLAALDAANAALLRAQDVETVSVPGATLFASTLGTAGPVYEEIRRWEFHR